MKIYQYKCTLLSDVIVTSEAATEGYRESLDYIPGSKFLGIAAGKLYDETNPQKTLDLFHNGTVKFGDATLVHQNIALYKVPFSWYHEKGQGLSESIFLHHKITETDQEYFTREGIQPKQARSGYFSSELGIFTTIEQGFSLKSAHSIERRRAKDSQLFGYYSMKAGSEWSFSINDQSGEYADELKDIMVGKHRIGRSRSAEYGLVSIEFMQQSASQEPIIFQDEVIIYAKSNLCFYDSITGRPTAQPTADQLIGTNAGKIDWNKSQVRSRNYKTWNRHRGNKDTERIIIERGSVFVVSVHDKANSTFLLNGIGSHQAEGFGEVLVNPEFLLAEGYELPLRLKKMNIDYLQLYPIQNGEKDDEAFACLQNIKNRNNFNYSIDANVSTFIKNHGNDFAGISKSQWGTLRNYAKNLDDSQRFATLIFDKRCGFLYKGQSEKEWRAKNRRVILENYLINLNGTPDYLPFVIKLSNLMAKKTKS